MTDDPLTCKRCGRIVERGDAIRTEPYGDLDPTRWQALCCPDCGIRLKTVLV